MTNERSLYLVDPSRLDMLMRSREILEDCATLSVVMAGAPLAVATVINRAAIIENGRIEPLYRRWARPRYVTFSIISANGNGHSVIFSAEKYNTGRKVTAKNKRALGRKNWLYSATELIHLAAACHRPNTCWHDHWVLVAACVTTIDKTPDHNAQSLLRTRIMKAIRETGAAQVITQLIGIKAGARRLIWVIKHAQKASL